MGVTVERARQLIDLYFKLFPGIRDYVHCSHEMAKINNFVVTPFGQRKMEYGVMPVFEKTAVYNAGLRNAQNVRVQSTTSTFGLQCFARTNTAIKPIGAKSLCTVYDSLEIECPISRAAECLELAFYHMDDEPVQIYDWLDLPVGVEAEIGFNWGDAVVVHRGVSQAEIEEILATMKR